MNFFRIAVALLVPAVFLAGLAALTTASAVAIVFCASPSLIVITSA